MKFFTSNHLGELASILSLDIYDIIFSICCDNLFLLIPKHEKISYCISVNVENGIMVSEKHCLNGDYHNFNGPAWKSWYGNGQLLCERYIIHGKYHNEKDFALIRYNECGTMIEGEYWLNDKKVNQL